MSEDLIRRSDAIKVIEPYLDYIEIIPLCGAKPYVREAVYGIRSKIESIPTIEPKQGWWVYCEEDDSHLPEDGRYGIFKCSNCGSEQSYPISEGSERVYGDNFCPNCGADMREREGE